MAKLKIVIGNVDIQTDGSPESAQLVRNVISGLLDIAFDAPLQVEAEKKSRKKLTNSKQDVG